jgi:hypothetical protein
MEVTHMTKYTVWTGPTQVQGAADLLRQAGLNVTLEGTEHVYLEANNVQEVYNALPNWSKRAVREVCAW